MKKILNQKFLSIAVFISCVLINILLIFSLEIYNNTLHESGNWVSRKANLARTVPASASYMNTMPALFKFKLNLSQWLGYHKLIFTHAIDASEVSFQYRIDNGQYFSFLFNSDFDGNKLSGIRISNNKLYPSIFFHMEKDKFIDRHLISNFTSDTKPHKFKIKFVADKMTVFIDDKENFTFEESALPKSFIGFKAGFTDLRSDVDDLIILQKDGSKFEDSFLNWKIIPRLTILSLLFSFSYLGLGYFVIQVMYKRYVKKNTLPTGSLEIESKAIYTLKSIFYLNFNILLISIFLAYAMYTRVSRMYFTWTKVYEGYAVMPSTHDTINKFLIPNANNKTKPRIWFVGSSQTWGAGVYKDEDTFVSLLEKEIKRTFNLDFINGGIAGTKTTDYLPIYKEHFNSIKPDIALINFSHNDDNTEKFIENLREFVRFNTEHKVLTIFSIEPVEIEFLTPNKNQEAMRNLAKELNVPMIDMHTKMLPHYDDGFLWWDRIHFTSFGNVLFANEMLEPLKNILRTHNYGNP
ncbi:MAG TPA: SGNH/GDSL hydrolase family protein [Leptospiraceae bacterium]|nr:SGNH/GDSL hydrolase family protein [Leptospiraceae bacterium]HRG76843.1 SGNH/GDSL hydrolase family protein [Leptospiraceae bacterium]